MNIPLPERSHDQDILLDARILTYSGDLAIRSCTGAEITGELVLVKDSTLLLVTKGNLQITHGTVNYSLGQNKMALLKKDTLVKYLTGSQQRAANTELVIVYLKDDLVKDFARQAQLSVIPPARPAAVTVDEIDGHLLKFLDSLQLYLGYESIDENITRIKLLELLFNLARKKGAILPQLMDLRQRFRADITTTVEDHLMDSTSLSQLAAFSGRSLSSFKRDFVAIYNMPPSKWLRQRRLEKARELFHNTTMTVTDVCYTLGFENLAHFSRLFKTHFGCPPSRFRTATTEIS